MSTAQNGEVIDSEHFSPYRPDGKLYGFVCIVTGSEAPIGRAIAIELASHGAACVYACSNASDDTSLDWLDEIQHRFPNTKLASYPYTSTSEPDTLSLLDDVLNVWGRLDVWICATLSPGPASVSDTGPQDLLQCFETNAMGAFFALKYAPPAMAKTTPRGNYANAAPKDVRYGSIVVVGSVASGYGGCGGVAYTMSGHAALGVVRGGVAELKGTGVRINMVSAGQIESGADVTQGGNHLQSPATTIKATEEQKKTIGLQRAGLPTEVARVAGFLASGFSSYITGANLVVDGGATTMNPLTMP